MHDAGVRQHPIELILLRQLASRLAFPVFLVSMGGTVVYRNPPADALLGFDPAEVPEAVPLPDLVARYRPVDAGGSPVPVDRVPVGVALLQRRPSQARLLVYDQRGGEHQVDVTAFPLEGQGGVPLGAMSIFWELDGAGHPTAAGDGAR
ncbi:MAG TPA: PAS domain-containing protein [Acidimicrobiia bacterium]|nr:PAS domain-containing protein [Acidimicrobiia bacterium]